MSEQNTSSQQPDPFPMGTFVVSGISASIAHFPHHPLYTLKSQMMFYGKEFSFGEFFKRTRITGRRFLFRGVLSRSVGVAPEKALKMAAWDESLHLIDQCAPQCPQNLRWAIGGTAAGAATTIIGCPSERAMVLAQIQEKGFWNVLRSAGVKGLYDGWRATLYRDIAFNLVLFVFRENIQKWYKSEEDLTFGMRILLGLPASLSAGIIACPFDVVKTRVQGKEHAVISHKSPLQIMRAIVRDEGPRYLFKGLMPRLVAVPLYMSVFLAVNDKLHQMILGRNVAH